MTFPTCTKYDVKLEPGVRFCGLCGAAVEPDRRPLSVRLQDDLGSGYVVMGELGSGGFAKVYLANIGRMPHVQLSTPSLGVSRKTRRAGGPISAQQQVLCLKLAECSTCDCDQQQST